MYQDLLRRRSRMLNFDVKKKINSLRDILVGKVPDPKAQVEQITIALIYKFMDDMDLEGIEFGASREFFKEDYEKYAWTNIMQPENSGQQRANLYAEGIDKMSMNPHLPQLFRDIFRGAYVPYRDAETLNMFLKEINDFSYDHSEDLGNAFEYLLSIMGSQGDAGQFRTPRHIIDMIVEIVDPKKTDSILDPACGTAGFLISSYKHILEKNIDKDGISTLSADERKRMTESFAGYDISPDMVRLSRVNMYLHKFTKPQISEYDALSSLDKWDETYDVILANPPFMTPKGGIIPHNRYRIPAKRAEVLFVDYIAEHLNPTGKAGVIVPEGIVFQSANAYKNLRKFLIEDDLLYAVISLPSGVFNPYSGVKTSILLMDRTLAKQKDEILFVKVNNDGFDLGAQRKEVKGSDIPEVIKIIKNYQNGNDVSDNPLVTIASKKDIAEQDYILVGERYKEAVVVNSNYPMMELGEICEKITKGTTPTTVGYDFADEGINFIKIESITENGDFVKEKFVHINEDCHNSLLRSQLKEKDVLFSIAGALGRVAVVRKDILPANTNQALAILSPKLNEVNPYYLANALLSEKVLELIKNMKVGVAQFNLSLKQVSEIKIPLPPLRIQEEIVKEIEGYQKIIDGARQVVENYKPTIKIDPNWELVKLGNICENLDSKRVPITSSDRNSGEYPYYGASGIVDYVDSYIFDEELLLLSEDGANLIARVTPIAFSVSGKVWVNNHAHVLKFDNNFTQKYTEFYINQMDISNYITGAAQPKLNQGNMNKIEIYLPPIEIQEQIVNQINEEFVIVEQNNRLIEIFEQKVSDRISEVWGE